MSRRSADFDAKPGEDESVLAELLNRVATNARRIRKAAKITQEEAAHRSRIATRLYVRIENEQTNFSAGTLARVAQGLGVDVSELVRRPRSPRR